MEISGGKGKELIFGVIILVVIIAGFLVLDSGKSGMTFNTENNTVVENTSVTTTESSNLAGRVSHNLVLGTVTKESVDTLLVYRTLPPEINKELTLDYAEIFNVTGTLKGERTVQSEDLRYYVTFTQNSGSVRYNDAKRPNVKQDAPEYLPSDEEAIEIATKFLKENGLYPDGAANPSVQRENAYTVGKGDEVYYSEIGVWYRRYLNGLEVKGTQLDVGVGGNGDIIEYFANWRDYEPYKEYPVIAVNEAFEDLKSQGVYVGTNSQDSEVVIDEAYLAYLTTAGAYTEDYLQPVWVFKGNVMSDDKAVMDVVQYVPALAEVPTELTST